MRAANRQTVTAVLAGVALAGAGLLAFNWLLDRVVVHQVRQDVEAAAKRKLALAENRIDRIVSTLDGLTRQGIDGCRAAQLEVLRRAVFSNVMIKEISWIGPDGRAACGTSGMSAVQRNLLASQRAIASPAVLIEVFDFNGGRDRHPNEKVIRIRITGGDRVTGLGAQLLGSSLIAQSSTEAEPLNGHSRLTMHDGTLIGESGARLDTPADVVFTADITSERYGMKVSTSFSQAAVRAHAARVHILGAAVTAGLTLLLLTFSFLWPRYERENPIAELERALRAGEFVPYYQPVVDLVSGKLRGAEVLIRWRKPDGSVVSPANFIPLAESSGIILDMTRALMRRACEEIGPAFAQRPHLKVSFNLAARHFDNETIVRDVRDIFGRSSVRLSQLVLELTERQPIDNLVETRRLIATLQGMGVRMAIDDVGTGHSGLSYILKLGVDIIKIDKMFIDAVGIERSSTTIIETLVDLAHNMRMEVIAEGVENFEQVGCLRERGVLAAQGFVFAPPLPGSSFLQLIEAIDPVAAEAAAYSKGNRAAA